MTVVLEQVLDSLRLPNGAYLASSSQDYSYVWLRDVVYIVLPFLQSSCNRYVRAYHALLDIFRRYEWKIDIHTRQRPYLPYEYIHARYSPDLQEMPQSWGHAQNDAIGLFLWGAGQGQRCGKQVIRDEVDQRILQKLVDYLGCLAYWQAPDNGMWEEGMEVHSSSLGAVVAGLRSVQHLVDIPAALIERGELALNKLLPAESAAKPVDLAQLSLIFPFGVLSRSMAVEILHRVSTSLERTFGCIRYLGDQYFNEGSEAEWCFGLPWLGLCYWSLGDYEQALCYWQKTQRIIPATGEVPELYIGGKGEPNANTPLGWATAMCILLGQRLEQKVN